MREEEAAAFGRVVGRGRDEEALEASGRGQRCWPGHRVNRRREEGCGDGKEDYGKKEGCGDGKEGYGKEGCGDGKEGSG